MSGFRSRERTENLVLVLGKSAVVNEKESSEASKETFLIPKDWISFPAQDFLRHFCFLLFQQQGRDECE